MEIPSGKKIYFLSDFHLGAPDHASSLVPERRIVDFLERIRKDAAVILIVGDLFDFWYEYRTVVPKGFVRILGKMAEITDSGIPIHFFIGNHDMWMKGYFEAAQSPAMVQAEVATLLYPRSFRIGTSIFNSILYGIMLTYLMRNWLPAIWTG